MKRSLFAGIGPAFAPAALACALSVISLTACSSASDDDPVTLSEYVTAIPTLATLEGTWVRDYSYIDTDESPDTTCRMYAKLAVAADGSYTLIEGEDETYSTGDAYYSYQAQKGTIQASTDGVVTRTYSKSMTKSGSNASDKISDVSDSAPWVTSASAVTEAYPWRVIDGAIATSVHVRTGTGAGIVGKWSEQDSISDKGTMTFTDTQLIADDFHLKDSTWAPDGSWTFDYTIANDHTLSLTMEGVDPWLLPVYLSGDVFISDKPEERFAKQ